MRYGFIGTGAAIVAAVSYLACSATETGSRDEEPHPNGAEPAHEVAHNALSAEANTGLAGYRHTQVVSKFALGDTNSTRSEQGMNKAVGTFGVFAWNSKTGWAAGLPNADAPTLAQAPLSVRPDVHNAAVRDYFVKCGLPESQIDAVKDYTGASASGRAGEGPDLTKIRLEYYISKLSRRTLTGIPIADSYAIARINANGDVVTENVFWPEVAFGVLQDAEGIRSTLADPAQKALYTAKLATSYATSIDKGAVTIHHTPGGWPGDFVAVATYDVPDPSGVATHHLDINGVEVKLPDAINPYQQ